MVSLESICHKGRGKTTHRGSRSETGCGCPGEKISPGKEVVDRLASGIPLHYVPPRQSVIKTLMIESEFC
jgi:hypothetical protein